MKVTLSDMRSRPAWATLDPISKVNDSKNVKFSLCSYILDTGDQLLAHKALRRITLIPAAESGV